LARPDGVLREPATAPDLFDLSGKVAFIAGGYGGIGLVLAEGLAARGAHVAIGGRRPELAVSAARGLTEGGHTALGIGFDMRQPNEIAPAVEYVVDKLGGLDILVNCVGIQREEPLLDVTEAAFDAVYTVNLKAAMFLGQAVARHQVAAKQGGRHVHLLSVRSQLGLRGSRLLGIRCQQERAGRVDPSARDGVGAVRHHRQWCGADIRRYRHGARVSGRSGVPRGARRAAFHSDELRSRLTFLVQSRSSFRPLQRSSPARCCMSTEELRPASEGT